MSDGPTQYGFDWGPMQVERLAHVEGRGYALMIRTKDCELQVYVTEKGKKIKSYPIRGRTF
jgi:hypothetical protein